MNDRLVFERDGQDWPNRDASRFVEAAGLSWHVQVMGQGPVVLLVHGTGASTHSYGQLAQILAKAFTVVVPDLPGHGFTDLPASERLSLPGMAEDIGQLLDALDLHPVLAVGHSAGAAILVQMCLDGRSAPAGLVSINGALLPFGSIAGQFFAPFAKLLVLNPFVPWFISWRAASPDAVARLIKNIGSTIEPQDVERYGRLFQTESHVSAALGMMAHWDLFTLERNLHRLEVPLVLAVGSADRAISPEDAFRVREHLPEAQVVLLHGLGHLAHEERPEEVAEIIVKAAQSADAFTAL
ncbi:MAG: alpha/beta fold hydrolase BchO [Methyloceanibacter sp.]|jgi:magnesium chelatase accessory protein